MRRPFAADAEIAGRADQAAAEVMLPETIDKDASGQWVVRAGDPAGQCRAPAGAVRPRRFDSGGAGPAVRREDDREGGFDVVAAGAKLAAFQPGRLCPPAAGVAGTHPHG